MCVTTPYFPVLLSGLPPEGIAQILDGSFVSNIQVRKTSHWGVPQLESRLVGSRCLIDPLAVKSAISNHHSVVPLLVFWFWLVGWLVWVFWWGNFETRSGYVTWNIVGRSA